MPKLRAEDTADLDVEELEDAEYSTEQFTSYKGDIPEDDTVLRAYVKAMWWTKTSNGSSMIKVLVEADENEDELEEYNGLPCWENMALTTGAKFKWAPFLEHFGLTIRDVKSKTIVAAEDDNIGAPITKIATFVPGSDESWCRIVVSREKYEGKWQAHVREWLEYDEDEDEGGPDDESEEDIDEEPETEDEPEPAPAPRGRRTAAKASKPAAAPESPRGARKPAPSRSGPQKSAPARSAAPEKPAAQVRGRGRRAAASDEPPF